MSIPLPSKPGAISEDSTHAIFEIEGLYPGYGQTIANSLRRVLLSSLKGAAITSIKIAGVGHEFSTIEGVKEDIVDLTLNLKQMRFRLHEDGPFNITLSVNGGKIATGKDFKTPSQVEIVTPDIHIATLTSKKAKIEIEATVESGLGYVPVEEYNKEKVEVGIIALDAAFSPVRHVEYQVENMRVGDRTDYNRVKLRVETDGSVEPRDAFRQAAQTLVEQFGALVEGFAEQSSHPKKEEKSSESKTPEGDGDLVEEESVLKTKLDELKFSSRTLNALREAGIKTVGGLTRKKELGLRQVEGIGDKGIQEIKKALGNFGITLKQ